MPLLTDIKLNDITNWKTGIYNQMNGVFTATSYSICTKELLEVSSLNYKLAYNYSNAIMCIAQFNSSKKFLRNVCLFNNSTLGLKSDVKYITLSLMNYNTKSTFATFEEIFAKGITISLKPTTAVTTKVTKETVKIDLTGIDVKSLSHEEKVKLAQKEIINMVTNFDDKYHDISALKLSYNDDILPFFTELKRNLKYRLYTECMANPFLLYTGNKNSVTNIYIMEVYPNDSKSLYDKASKVADELVEIVSKMESDLDKILYVHDYIVHNSTYDKVTRVSGRAGLILGDQKGCCAGYANAMQYILQRCNVDIILMNSSAMNHAWNLVNIDGECYQIDACWDNTKSNNDGLSHRYFLVNDDEMQTISPKHYGFYPQYYDDDVILKDSDIKSTSTRFSNSFLHNVKGRMWYHDGLWYYLDGNTVMRSDALGAKQEVYLESDEYKIELIGITDGYLDLKFGENALHIQL